MKESGTCPPVVSKQTLLESLVIRTTKRDRLARTNLWLLLAVAATGSMTAASEAVSTLPRAAMRWATVAAITQADAADSTGPRRDGAGGIVVEYEADPRFGTGLGPISPDSDGVTRPIDDATAAAREFLASRGLREGSNPNGVLVFIGEARITEAPHTAGEGRVRAAQRAMLAAKREFVQFMGASARSKVESTYRTGDPFAALQQAKSVASRPLEALSIEDRLRRMVQQELEETPAGPGAGSPPANAESRRRMEDELRQRVLSVCAEDRFARAAEIAAQAELGGLQAYRYFESRGDGGAPTVAVAAIYSPRSARLQAALLNGEDPPKSLPAVNIGDWARGLGETVLMYTHGCQLRTNESGEVVLVCFGQVTPLNPNEDPGRGYERASARATELARAFLGEVIKSREIDSTNGTITDFADATSIVRDESRYESEIYAIADPESVAGGLNEYRWKRSSGMQGPTTFGVVRVFSLSEARRAADLRKAMEVKRTPATAGDETGPMGSAPAAAPTAAPAEPTPSPSSSGGAGAMGEPP